MRKLSGYRIEHFQSKNFYTSQYFALLDLINLENELEEKEYKRSNKKLGKK